MKSFLRDLFLVLCILIAKLRDFHIFCLVGSWKKEVKVEKVIGLLVVNSVLLSFVYGEAVGQVLQNKIATQQFKEMVSEFILPNAYGKITDAKYEGSDTVVVNIQDLHLNPEVQKNIANTIRVFDDKYGIKKIYMEGASGEVDTSWLSKIKDKKRKEKTVNELLETGMLTGAEYYAVISNRPEMIKGLEKKEEYEGNLKRFGRILTSQKEISTILESIEKDIKYLKRIYFNKKQRKAEELSNEYAAGKITAKKYYALIGQYARNNGIDIEAIINKKTGEIEVDNKKYRNIGLYITLLKESDKINYKESTKQLQNLIVKLKEALPYQAYKMITEETSNFQDIDKLYAFLIKFAKEVNIDLSINYPELNKLFKQVELSRNINPIKMLEEEERLENELNGAFASDQGSKEVAFLAWFAYEYINYFTTKISADNHEWYKENIKEWKRLYVKYIDNKKLEMLEPYEKMVDEFYDVNVERNQYFIENLDFIKEAKKVEIKTEKTEREIEKVIEALKEAKNVNVVVTGGFHTQALSEMLAKEGISYIVITPNVSEGVEEAERAYHALAKEQSKVLSQSLATEAISQLNPQQKLVAIAQVLIERNSGTEEIGDALEYIAPSIEEGIAVRMSGDVKKKERVVLRINDKDFVRDAEGTFVEQPGQEEVGVGGEERRSLEKSVASAGFTGIVNLAFSLVSVPFLFLIPLMSWAWPFMFIPLLVFIPCLTVSIFEFHQSALIEDAQLEIDKASRLALAGASDSEIPQGEDESFVIAKILNALPIELRESIGETKLQLDRNMDRGVVMNYSEQGNAIHINLSMLKILFLDPLNKNIVNQKLLVGFIKHELAHRGFANTRNEFRYFIHIHASWLEELIVSFGDPFRSLGFRRTTVSAVASTGSAQEGVPAEVRQRERKGPQEQQQVAQVEYSKPTIEPIPIAQEEKIYIDPKVKAFTLLIRSLPFRIQRRFAIATLGDRSLAARFISIIITSDEKKWQEQLANTENKDIIDAITLSSFQEDLSNTMITTDVGRIRLNFDRVNGLLQQEGKSGIISLIVESRRAMDRVEFIEAKAITGISGFFKRLKNRAVFIALYSLFRRISLAIMTTERMRKISTEWTGISITWTPPEDFDLPIELQESINKENARIDDEGRLVEPFVIYGRQRFSDGRRGVLERNLRITYKNGSQKELKNFPTGTKLEDIIDDKDEVASIEISYNFIPETCGIRFDIGYIDNPNFLTESHHPLVKGIRNHEVGMAYHVDGFTLLPTRIHHKLIGCRYINRRGEIVEVDVNQLKEGFDIDGKDIDGDMRLQFMWEPTSRKVKVEIVDRGDIINLEGRKDVRVDGNGGVRMKALKHKKLSAGLYWCHRLVIGLSGGLSGVETHTVTWEPLPDGIIYPSDYIVSGENKDFKDAIYDGTIINTPPIRTGHIMLKNGRIGTVTCIVTDADTGERLDDFKFGETEVHRNIKIKYEVKIDEEECLVHFETNGGKFATTSEHVAIKVKDRKITIPAGFIPIRDGYTFKGYKAIKCLNSSFLGVNLGDEHVVLEISPEQLIDGYSIDNVDGDLVLVAQWQQEGLEEKDTLMDEEFSKSLIWKALTFPLKIITFLLKPVTFLFKFVARTLFSSLSKKFNSLGPVGKGIFIVVSIITVIGITYLLWHLIKKYAVQLTWFAIKLAIIFTGFKYLNKLEKVLFIFSLTTIFIASSLFLPFLTGAPLIIVAAIIIVAFLYILYCEYKMKKGLWQHNKRLLGKIGEFVLFVGGRVWGHSKRIVKTIVQTPMERMRILKDCMTNIADNLSEIPIWEGHEFVGLQAKTRDGQVRTFTLKEMENDFLIPPNFIQDNGIVQLECVWQPSMKITFLPGVTGEVQNIPKEITMGVARGENFMFPGFTERGFLGEFFSGKYPLPKRTGYTFNGLVIKIEGQADINLDRESAKEAIQIPADRMTGPVIFEILWQKDEGYEEEAEAEQLQEEESTDQTEQEESSQPTFPTVEPTSATTIIDDLTQDKQLAEPIETFAQLIRALPFRIQNRYVAMVLGTENSLLISQFISLISKPDGLWQSALLRHPEVIDNLLEILNTRSFGQETIGTTGDGRINLNLTKIRSLLTAGNSGIRTLVVQSMKALHRIDYIESAIAVSKAAKAAEIAKKAALAAADDDLDEERRVRKKAKAVQLAQTATETAATLTLSIRIRAFIRNNLYFLEVIIIFFTSIWRTSSIAVRSSIVARKLVVTWGDVSAKLIPPEGFDDTITDVKIDEQGRLIEPLLPIGKHIIKGTNRRGRIERIIKITDKDGNHIYLSNDQHPRGKPLPEGTKAVEILYNFIPDTCQINFDMGNPDAQSTHPLVRGIRNHEIGMAYHVEGFGSQTPTKKDHTLVGCRYLTEEGEIIFIPKKLLEKGFDIEGNELGGDLTLHFIWKPDTIDAEVQIFDGDTRVEMEGNQKIKVVAGHGIRVKGLAPGIADALIGWARRAWAGVTYKQSGVKTHDIKWAKLPHGLRWPDNYETDGPNEDFIGKVEAGMPLQTPPMRTGRIRLTDGRVATVRCKVIDIASGREITDFKFGETKVDRDLRIQYEITNEEQYYIHVETDDGREATQIELEFNDDGTSTIPSSMTIPIRDGYVCTGFKFVHYHRRTLGHIITEESYEEGFIDSSEIANYKIEGNLGDITLVAQWITEAESLEVSSATPQKKKGEPIFWNAIKNGFSNLSTTQKIFTVFSMLIFAALYGTLALFPPTFGLVIVIKIVLAVLGTYISIQSAKVIFGIITSFLSTFLTKAWEWLKLNIPGLAKLCLSVYDAYNYVRLGELDKPWRICKRIGRQIYKAPINYFKNFNENMVNIADNLSSIPKKDGYMFGGLSVINERGEIIEFSLEEISRDFSIPFECLSSNEQGERIVKLSYIWIPKVTITTGTGTTVEGSQKSSEIYSRKINLGELKDSVVPPEGFDFTTLEWEIKIDGKEPQIFPADHVFEPTTTGYTINPIWKKLPQARMSVGNGTWKETQGSDASKAREVKVKATRQGAMVDLRDLKDELEAPDDCDPESLYFTIEGRDDTDVVNSNEVILIKEDMTYVPHWKTFAERNKVKLKIGDGRSIILNADQDGFIDLNAVVREHGLKPPNEGFTNEAYWTANGDSRELSGRINIRSISVLTLHWRISQNRFQNGGVDILGQEGAEELDNMKFSHSIEFHSGVEESAVDNVSSNLHESFRTFAREEVRMGSDFTFPGFTEGRFGINVAGRIKDATVALIYGTKLPIPTREGFDFNGLIVDIGGKHFEYTRDQAMNGFSIPSNEVLGTIKITFKWKIHEERRRRFLGLFKSEESAEGAVEAAVEIGALLGSQAAVDVFTANGVAMRPLEAIKRALDDFTELERFQVSQIQEAQRLIDQDNYFKGRSNEEIIRELVSKSGLSAEDASMFLRLVSEVELEGTGEVMSYEPNTQDPSKAGRMHVNYKMLRAMFLDAGGNVKDIEMFKVFVKHELTHMEFATSENPLYKIAHSIPFLEEFLVSFSDLYVYEQQSGIVPTYGEVINFIFSNARILSIAAGISIGEAVRISSIYTGTGLLEKEMAIGLLVAAQEMLGTSMEIGKQRALSLFVEDRANGERTRAFEYAERFGGIEGDHTAAVVEHIPSHVLVPIGYSHRMSVNVSFDGLVYDVYVKNVKGRIVIGLKLKKGEDSTQHFAGAVQFFANDINTNEVLRRELSLATGVGISPEGVEMIDFIGFPAGVTTQESVQRLYQTGSKAEGLVGVYRVEDLDITTSESLSKVEQEIKAAKLFKLDKPEKYYELEMAYERLSNIDFIKRALEVKKKEEATTIILNITNFDVSMLSSEETRKILMTFIEIVHSMEMTVTIEIEIEKAREETFRSLLELRFDGISIDAKNQDIKDIENIKRVVEELTRASSMSSISEKNTIHLKSQEVREMLGDLSGQNILTITEIDEETNEAKIDEQQALDAIEVGYERGRRVLEQGVIVEAENIRALLEIFNRPYTSITVNEIMEIVRKAGLGAIPQKHIESLLKGLGKDVTGRNYRVAQAIGFVRGLVESYAVEIYLDAYGMSYETLSENDLNDIKALGVLLAALFMIDTNNNIFKDTTALKTFFKQAKNIALESQTDESLSSARQKMVQFSNLIIVRFEQEQDITDLVLSQGNISQRLYISLAILNDSINKISFRTIVERTEKRTKAPASAIRNILGDA